MKLFGFLKNLFGSKEAAAPAAPAAMPAPAPAPAPVAKAPAPSNGNGNGHGYGNGNGNGNGNGAGHSLELPLQSVIAALPLELRGRVQQVNIGDAVISIPLERVLTQLGHGAVKISFGELRMAAPQIFLGSADRDATLVTLPLAEILARLNPSLLMRRPAQKQVEVPNEIVSPFNGNGPASVLSAGNPNPAPAVVPPAAPIFTRNVTPVSPVAPAASGGIPIVPRNTIFHAPTPQPPTATPAQVNNSAPIPASPAMRALQPGPKPAAQPPAPVPISPIVPQQPIPMSKQLAAQQPAAPAPEQTFFSVPMAALVPHWPETVQQEIAQLSLREANLSMPTDLIEAALRKGRIVFAWKMLRSWIKPAPLPCVSAHDSIELELPLQIIAPLFLNRQKSPPKPQQRAAVDETIPNLFFGFPQPAPTPAPAPISTSTGNGNGNGNGNGHGHAPSENYDPTPAPVLKSADAKLQDTNFYIFDDKHDVAHLDATQLKRSPQTDMLVKTATPNEIVGRTASLPGVAGAIIAMPDGLLVAAQVPADQNAETLAAFLPQIFGRMSQCAKELRMGEINNLNFTVGNVPWKIFRINSIFFAAFGMVGGPLPTAQLAALATELDHKKRQLKV